MLEWQVQGFIKVTVSINLQPFLLVCLQGDFLHSEHEPPLVFDELSLFYINHSSLRPVLFYGKLLVQGYLGVLCY